MEIADIFVINKSDRPGVEKVETELSALLSIHHRRDGWKPRIVRTIASAREGIGECAAAIEEYRTYVHGSDFQKDRAIQMLKDRLLEAVRSRLFQSLLRDQSTALRIDELARQMAERRIDPFTAAEELLERSFGKDLEKQE